MKRAISCSENIVQINACGPASATMIASSLSGIAYPFGPGHINVKSLFAVIHALRREVGMKKALEILGLPLEGKHHRAGDDAWNIARILGELLLRARRVG